MDHVVSDRTKHLSTDLKAIRRTPLRQLSPAQVRPIVERITKGGRTAPVDVAAFNSSI